ncbi:MAG TPA: ribosome assembly factor SBDS [Nitrososphaerales archaeon]|nr:ribosome assembly factor SBDS [Nitrososphaerales archaeon]
MSSRYTTVRLVVDGEHFEILVNPDPALNFKLGKQIEPSQVIAADEVFSDSSKGLRVGTEKLKKYFKTEDAARAAVEVLRRGELQLTQEQRKKLLDEKRKSIVTMIAKTYVDPRTSLPHPPIRVEQAMQEARISIDPFQDASEQTKMVVEKIRSIIPLKSERVRLLVRVSPQYSGQTIGVLKNFGEILKEDWGADGTLSAIVEIPAGSQPGLLEKLGSNTKGAAQATLVK